MARKPTRLDRALGYGLQPHERPVKLDTEALEPAPSKTTTTNSEATTAPSNQAEQDAEIKRKFREQLLALLDSPPVRASALAVIGKYLERVGLLDPQPGATQAESKVINASLKGMPLPFMTNPNDPNGKSIPNPAYEEYQADMRKADELKDRSNTPNS